jgi:hypothetical protein
MHRRDLQIVGVLRVGFEPVDLVPFFDLGGQLKTGNLWTAQNRQFPWPVETV